MVQINRPGVLGVWLFDGVRKLPHAVALLAMNQDMVAIGDPSQGKIYALNRSQFARIWRQQYVPIFRQGEDFLTDGQVMTYLKQLNYPATQSLSQSIQNFQAAIGIKPTGQLDPQTVLLLSGQFLQDSPTLSEQKSSKLSYGKTR